MNIISCLFVWNLYISFLNINCIFRWLFQLLLEHKHTRCLFVDKPPMLDKLKENFLIKTPPRIALAKLEKISLVFFTSFSKHAGTALKLGKMGTKLWRQKLSTIGSLHPECFSISKVIYKSIFASTQPKTVCTLHRSERVTVVKI